MMSDLLFPSLLFHDFVPLKLIVIVHALYSVFQMRSVQSLLQHLPTGSGERETFFKTLHLILITPTLVPSEPTLAHTLVLLFLPLHLPLHLLYLHLWYLSLYLL